MKFLMKWALALVPALAVATPALAIPPTLLSDSEQPGSVIVFPKFIDSLLTPTGSLLTVDGVPNISQTEIEVGVVCPPQVVAAGFTCTEHLPIKIRFHWVCPGIEGVNSNICQEENFDVWVTINGKVAFSADGNPINSNSPPLVPAPPCARGYLIGWVISPINDLPVKFDGLIGNAVIRNGPLLTGPNAGTSTSLSAYQAITIQADPNIVVTAPPATVSQTVVPGPAIPTSLADGGLHFGVAGGYTTITGVQIGDVRFDKTTTGAPLPNILSRTALTFLTLDVLSDLPNAPTFVHLRFFNESLANTIGSGSTLFEHETSFNVEFVCWAQFPLSALAGGNLTQAFQGTRKGIVIAGPAHKVPDGNAPADVTVDTPTTLIGLVETIEGTAANGFLERKYNFNMSTNGAYGPIVAGVETFGPVITTTFLPSPNFQ